MDYKNIGERLTLLRQEKGLSQEELAEMLNVDKRKIARYETSMVLPDIDVLIKLSNVFNTSIDYLACITDVRDKFPKKKRTIFKLFNR